MWSRRKKIAVEVGTTVLAVTLVVAASAVWYAYYGPITVKAALEHMHWNAGETKDVEGTITDIRRMNTSYGPIVQVQLDGYTSLCNTSDLLADPSREYHVGERFKTTLHFTEYSFNNDSGVWAPELLCPIPGLFSGFGITIDAVSYVEGFILVYGGMNRTNWTTYRIVTRNGEAFPLRVFNITLMKGEPFGPSQRLDSAAEWIYYAAAEYTRISGVYTHYASVVDRMESLTGGTSENGSILFVDKTSDGYLDDGDEVLVHIPPTIGDWDYQTYMLCFGNCWGFACAGGLKYIINGHEGPYDWVVPTGDLSRIILRHTSDHVALNVTSVIEVSGGESAVASPYSDFSFYLQVGDRLDLPARKFNETPTMLPDGTMVDYQDGNANGLLDAGDTFTISGLANRTFVRLILVLNGAGDISTEWITGYGHVVGNLPYVRLTSSGQSPYRINASVPWWHQELAIGKTLVVALWENSTRVLDNVTLSDGMVATFPGGDLSWTDNDHDGFLSTGDFFTVSGNHAARYKLELSVLFGYGSSTVEFGP